MGTAASPAGISKWILEDSENPRLIFPQTEYKNAEEFYADFPNASIPFISGTFQIQVVPDYADPATEKIPNMCYKNATALAISTLSLAFTTLAAVLA